MSADPWCSGCNPAAPTELGRCAAHEKARLVAESLLESDALTPNHDGTPEHYIVDAENVEYLVRTVLALAAPPSPGRPVERTRGHEEDERE